MQEIISQQIRQIKIIDEGLKRQLKKMLKKQGYHLDVIYDDSTSYVIVDADGYEYEIKTFNMDDLLCIKNVMLNILLQY